LRVKITRTWTTSLCTIHAFKTVVSGNKSLPVTNANRTVYYSHVVIPQYNKE